MQIEETHWVPEHAAHLESVEEEEEEELAMQAYYRMRAREKRYF